MKRHLLLLFLMTACEKDKDVTVTTATAPPSPPPLSESCGTICDRTIACAGAGSLPADATKAKRDECVHVCTGQGKDNPLAGEIIPGAMAEVAQKCGAAECDKFADCYMDTLKAVQDRLLGGSSSTHAGQTSPIAPDTRTRFVKLVCDVVAESPGHIPDLSSPNPSPKLRELVELTNTISEQHGASAIADLMKEAIATCSK